MRIASRTRLAAVAIVAAAFGSQAAHAEDYHLVGADAASTCQTGTKTDPMTLEGPRETSIARAHGDKLNVAVCVGDDSKGAVHVRWKANGYWKSSGNISNGCAEVLGASKVKVRAVNTNFHQTATYYTCVKE